MFTDIGLNKLKLLDADLVELTETKVGILVTDKKRNLALIPQKEIHYDLVDRVIR